MVKAIEPPFVPTPAPALISPVGCSSTNISIILEFFIDPSVTFLSTSEKMPLALILAIDCFN